MIEYALYEDQTGRFWVGHQDENDEWWDADLDGFDTLEAAEAFRIEIQSEQDAIQSNPHT